MGRAAVGLGPQEPAQALGLLLAGAEGAETWMATVASGRSIAKLATLETTSTGMLARAELLEEPLALLDRGGAGDQRGVQPRGELVELVEVLADDQDLFAGVAPPAAPATTTDLAGVVAHIRYSSASSAMA